MVSTASTAVINSSTEIAASAVDLAGKVAYARFFGSHGFGVI